MELTGVAPTLNIIPAPIGHTFSRTDVINTIIERRFPKPNPCRYLEVGVRDPGANFDHIKATRKEGVDPGTEAEAAQFSTTHKMTSDEYFETHSDKFDIIFIDALHISSAAWADIQNSLQHLNPNGFIVVHDCSPPSWDRAHSDYKYFLSKPHSWNGTVWKAWYLARTLLTCATVCVDCDEGCGIISTSKALANPVIPMDNPFFDYGHMATFRKQHLGLVSVEDFKNNFDTLL